MPSLLAKAFIAEEWCVSAKKSQLKSPDYKRFHLTKTSPMSCNNIEMSKNHRAVLCDNCDLWAHIKYGNISEKPYTNMSNNKDIQFRMHPFVYFPRGHHD